MEKQQITLNEAIDVLKDELGKTPEGLKKIQPALEVLSIVFGEDKAKVIKAFKTPINKEEIEAIILSTVSWMSVEDIYEIKILPATRKIRIQAEGNFYENEQNDRIEKEEFIKEKIELFTGYKVTISLKL